jgi:long-subunit acyl-CoA synthetase (AMP-forming)
LNFLGYHNNEELTAKRIRNGWFFTGEIGKWNPDGSITILGHKEEVLEPVYGEYILYPFSSFSWALPLTSNSARHLEFTYSQSSFVHQIFICSKPYHSLVAVIVPDYEVIYYW